jgi:mediator of RNA polymerase II transcription subunit 5
MTLRPGESQPVYDEFGGILLLILAFRYRLSLTPVELGARDNSSFVRRLIESNSADRRIDELDEETSKHLGDWISALFVAEQLSDELTSSCSPQEYYSLVPALLNQSLEACESGKLSLETLKSGFDCG